MSLGTEETQEMWAENWGCARFLERGAGSPSSTMWPEPRPTSIPSGILIHPSVCMHSRQGPKIGRALSPFLRRNSPSNTMLRVEAYLATKWHLDPSSHLATTDMGRK